MKQVLNQILSLPTKRDVLKQVREQFRQLNKSGGHTHIPEYCREAPIQTLDDIVSIHQELKDTVLEQEQAGETIHESLRDAEGLFEAAYRRLQQLGYK